jgi:hypothetical protein
MIPRICGFACPPLLFIEYYAVIGQAGFAGYRGSAAVPAGGQVPATGETPGQGQGRHLLHRLSGTLGLSSVLLHNGGFCNGCVAKRFLHK